MTINNENAEVIFTLLAVIGAVGAVIAWYFTRDTPHKNHSSQKPIRK